MYSNYGGIIAAKIMACSVVLDQLIIIGVVVFLALPWYGNVVTLWHVCYATAPSTDNTVEDRVQPICQGVPGV